MIDIIKNNSKCFTKHCNKEQLLVIQDSNNRLNIITNLINDFTNKKITEKEYLKNMKNINKNILSNYNIDLLKCQFNNCYSIMIKNITKILQFLIKEYTNNPNKKFIILIKDTYNKLKKNKLTVYDYIDYNKKFNNLIINKYK